MANELNGTPGRMVAEWAPGRSNPSAAPASDTLPRRPVRLYGLHRRRNRRIGWSVVGACVAASIVGSIVDTPGYLLGSLFWGLVPFLLTFAKTRPVMWT